MFSEWFQRLSVMRPLTFATRMPNVSLTTMIGATSASVERDSVVTVSSVRRTRTSVADATSMPHACLTLTRLPTSANVIQDLLVMGDSVQLLVIKYF